MSEHHGHILCVIYGNDLFGSERGTLRAARSLQDAGYKVTIAGSKRKSGGGEVGEAARAQGHDVKLIQFGSHLKKTWLLYNRHYRKSTWRQIKLSHRQFRTIVRDCQPSHIMVCTTSALPYLIGFLLFTRIPIIYRMGDAPVLQSPLHRRLWKWLIYKSTTIVTISDYMKSLLQRHGRFLVRPEKVHVIRNIAPIRTTIFDKALAAKLKQTKRPFQLVFVGQLTPQKGTRILIEALFELNDPNIGCWIIGKGMGNTSFADDLKQWVENTMTRTNIEMLGYVSDPRPYYQSADWHITPSIYEEPLGNVVQEAQLQGTPSIVTKKGGLPELLNHQVTGWILEGETKESIVQCIRGLVNSPAWTKGIEKTILDKNKQYGLHEFSQAWLEAVDAQ